jgi:drug/metabolite transporter (DMT)-like permease
MTLSNERQGELYIFASSILWSLFPIVTIFSLINISPLISLAGSSFFASAFFAVFLSIKKKWHELKNTSAYKDMLLASLILGVGYYVLVFWGLQYTSAGNSSIVGLSEVFFSYLIFNIWKKDKISQKHLIGSILCVLGVIVVFLPSLQSFQIGDVLILIASSIAPLGNYFMRRARTFVSSESIMFVRSSVSAIVVLLLAFVFHSGTTNHLEKNALVFFAINGVVLLGVSKIMWIESIHRISVVKANALGSISPLLTILFAWLLLKTPPTSWQLLSFFPMAIGVFLLSGEGKKLN